MAHHFCFHQPNQNQPFFNNTVLSNRCQFQSRYNYNAQKPSSLTLLFENQFQFNHMNCFCMIKNILHAAKYWWILVLCDKIEIEMITLVMTSQVMIKKVMLLISLDTWLPIRGLHFDALTNQRLLSRSRECELFLLMCHVTTLYDTRGSHQIGSLFLW